jgi:hypothetical protein
MRKTVSEMRAEYDAEIRQLKARVDKAAAAVAQEGRY